MRTSFWQGRRVLVTGATGMIGSCLTRALLDGGAHVVVLVRDVDPQAQLYRSGDIARVSVVSGALEDFWTLERAVNLHEVEFVFHLGAQTIVGTANRFPLPTLEANIRGTYNVLEACRIHSDMVRGVLVASSDKAYGDQPELPYTEEAPLMGRYPYEVSKTCADLLAQAYHHSYELPTGVVRSANCFGAGDQNWSRIVPGTIRSLLRGERPIIRSDGNFVRDYIYVEDLAGAYMCLAEGLEADPELHGDAFNFSYERPVLVLELVDMIRDVMDCRHIEPDILDEAEGEIRSQWLAAKKARAVLGWEPRFDLESGLAKTIEWYREFLP